MKKSPRKYDPLAVENLHAAARRIIEEYQMYGNPVSRYLILKLAAATHDPAFDTLPMSPAPRPVPPKKG